MSTDKARYSTFLLYPGSIPENWGMELELMDTPMAISPLHDKNKGNVERQGYKKARYHVIYVAANPVTTHSVRKRIQRALGNKNIAKIQVVKRSTGNMYLYLTHESKDAIAKNKREYAKEDIKFLSGFNIDGYVMLDVEGGEGMLNDVCDMIGGHDLANIRELRRLVKEHGSDYNLPSVKTINSVLCSHTGLIRLYPDAMYQECKYGQSYIDTRTGEIKK